MVCPVMKGRPGKQSGFPGVCPELLEILLTQPMSGISECVFIYLFPAPGTVLHLFILFIFAVFALPLLMGIVDSSKP